MHTQVVSLHSERAAGVGKQAGLRHTSMLWCVCKCHGTIHLIVSGGFYWIYHALQDLFVAHVGDSGAFVVRDGKARRLTLDHKPTNPAERERIANAGGMVCHSQSDPPLLGYSSCLSTTPSGLLIDGKLGSPNCSKSLIQRMRVFSQTCFSSFLFELSCIWSKVGGLYVGK